MVKRIHAFSLTDIGRERKNNQDACAVFKKRDLLLMVVADGVGGNKCGDIASRLTVETLQEKFEDTKDLNPKHFLTQGAKEINRRLRAYVASHPECRGMATTLTAALIQYPRLHILHVGDSRGYLLRKGTLQRLTEDHTLVQRMLKEGLLTAEEAKSHPKRHVIVNAMGVSDNQRYDYSSFNLGPGDQILLCSDGLHDEVDEEEIRDLLLKHEPKEAIRQLVDAANAAGGRDNVSVSLAALEGGRVLLDTKQLEPVPETPASRARYLKKWVIVALCLGALIAGAWGGSKTPTGKRARKYISSLFSGDLHSAGKGANATRVKKQ